MDLLDLRKYAVDHRVEIKFGNPHSHHECQIDKKGQVRIADEDKDFRIEDVFDAAEKFVIIGNGSSQIFTREELSKAVGQKRKSGPAVEEEE